MSVYYFSIGTSLAALANVEVALTYPPHVLDDQRIPFIAEGRKQTLDGGVSRNGWINADMQWDMLNLADLDAFIVATWGSRTVASLPLYASWLDGSGHYSPYLVTLESPREREHYTTAQGLYARNIVMPGWNWVMQTVTKAANYSVTSADRFIYVDTSAASRTMTLPAASSPAANTPFSFVKTSASNSMIIARAGSDTINGGTSSITTTALNGRVDLVSDHVSAWVTI